MPKATKGKKDIAFDKERAKYRSEINDLRSIISTKEMQIKELTEKLDAKDKELYESKEWIDRLLEYTEIPKEDLKFIIGQEKTKIELQERLMTITSMLNIGRF